MSTLKRPAPEELPEAYRGYLAEVCEEGDIVLSLAVAWTETKALLRGIEEERAGFRYQEGKWTIKEILIHLMDTERIFVARALRFARGDSTELPGFDQDRYVLHYKAGIRTLGELIEEFQWMRGGHLRFWRGLPEAAWQRRGVANGCEFTVAAIPWVLAGHERHHRRIIRERYL